MIIVQTTTVEAVVAPEPDLPNVSTNVGLTLLLTGADGSTWDLTNGPVRAQPGVGGLLPADVEHRWSPRTVTHRGYGEAPHTFQLPVFLHSTPGLPFRDLDAMFWRALSPDGECVLTAVTPDASVRTRRARFVGVGELALDRDPFVMGHQAYPLMFTAPSRYWYGAEVSQTFKPLANPPTAFAPLGGVINLVSESTTADSRVRNDADVPAWAKLTATGSVAGFSVTVDGDNTTAYGPIAAAQAVWIDTDPARQTVGFAKGENDETAWLGLTARSFAPIPAGAEVPISIVLDTPGADAALTVSLAPRWRKPW